MQHNISRFYNNKHLNKGKDKQNAVVLSPKPYQFVINVVITISSILSAEELNGKE
jgi:hypothetical protein